MRTVKIGMLLWALAASAEGSAAAAEPAASQPAPAAPPTTTQCDRQQEAANKTLLREAAEEMFVRRNLAAIERYYAEDYIQHDPARAARARELNISDREQTREFFSGFFAAFPDVKIAIDHLHAECDRVFAVVTWRGTQQGPFMGMKPTGQPMQVRSADIFRVAGGRFVEHWDVVDGSRMFSLAKPGS